MGMKPETAIGKTFHLWGNKGTIIGVVKDFNYQPVHKAIEPLVLRYQKNSSFFIVRTNPGNTEATIDAIKNICARLNPGYPFAYDFVDQDIAKLYRAEQQMGSIFNVFTILAIFISCLGLFGLASFVAEQRTKEIGIRKVVGASVFNLWGLLSKEFIGLVLISCCIAAPVAYYYMNGWLRNYSYRTDITWYVFAMAIGGALVITLLTVSFQAIKAAIANPIKSLRTE